MLNIKLSITEVYMIEQLLQQEINFCEQEPEHDEEIKHQIKPYKRLFNKLQKVNNGG